MDRKAERLGSLAEALDAAWAVREDFLKEVTSEQNWSEEEEKSSREGEKSKNRLWRWQAWHSWTTG